MKKCRISILIAAFVIAAAFSASAQTEQRLKEAFVRCAGMPSVTGREAAFVAYLRNQLPAGMKSEIDNMGNLIVQAGTAAPGIMVIAALDEPGFLVTDITEDGFLRVSPPGGRMPGPLFVQFHEGHYVDIAARGGPVRGVVALPSSHLVRGRRESLAPERFLIDIGARSRQEAQARGVEMLTPVTAVKDIAQLAGNRIAGPMLSRKFGAFALLETLKGISLKADQSMIFAWTTQSAMSNSGAARLARRFAPGRVIVVGPFPRGTGRAGSDAAEILGGGVLIPDANSPGGASPLLRSALSAAGSRIKLTALPAVAPPEARLFNSDLLGIGIPVLFPGSLVETVDLGDLQQLIEFLKAMPNY